MKGKIFILEDDMSICGLIKVKQKIKNSIKISLITNKKRKVINT